jgi:putative nucleotidyltransferase with HDIG domain
VILEQARSRLGVDAADILLLDRGERTLVLGARDGFGTEALAHTRLALGEGLAGRIAADRRTLILRSLAEEPGAFAASPSFAAEGFVAYGGVPLVAKDELLGVLEVYNRSPLDAAPVWESFFEALAGQAAIALENADLLSGLHHANEELRGAYESTIEGWAEALELRDRETEGHSRRVTEASLELAKALGVGGTELVSLRHGALLHDIGKMGIPDSILLKPGKLTEEEFETMKGHTTIGRDLLARLSFLGDAVDIPYAHHEKWDGTGYPRGLAREDIPFAARLFSIVDVWDALCSNRPYRRGWPEEKALQYIESLADKQFDPRMVAVFVDQRRSRLRQA